jgi:hypothetical protein
MPGDADGVLQLVGVLRNYVNECQILQERAASFDSSFWIGSAAAEFRRRYEAFAPKLSAVSLRLGDTASILNGFATQLSPIQSQALSASTAAGSILNEIQAVTPLANEQRAFQEQQRATALVGKPPRPWTGPNYILQESELQNQYRAQQATFNECVASYNTLAAQTASRLSHISKDSLTNTWLSEIEHYSADVALVALAPELDDYRALVASVDFFKEHMTQTLDVIGVIVAVAAIGAAIVGTDGAAAAALPALIGWVSVGLGAAQITNSSVRYGEGHGTREDLVLGITEGVLSMASGGLIGQAARGVDGAADAESTLSQIGGDVIDPPTAVVPSGATFTTSFAYRLATYTRVLNITNLTSSIQSVGADINSNFSLLDLAAL